MRGLITGLLAGLAAVSPASATFTYTFFNISGDSSGTYSSYYQDLRDAVSAAGDQWAQYIPASANVEVQITLVGSANFLGDSPVSYGSNEKIGGVNIVQPGVEYKLNGNPDPNGTAADLNFVIGTQLLSQLWFDPNPASRTDAVPVGQYDAISLFMRGFGRSLGFASYFNPDGTLQGAGADKTVFDLSTTFPGGNPFFNGSEASAWNGGGIALSNESVYLLSGIFGSDVMSNADAGGVNGLSVGQRYFVSGLDLAILRDSGLNTLAVPEPGTVALLGLGSLVAVGAARRRRTR